MENLQSLQLINPNHCGVVYLPGADKKDFARQCSALGLIQVSLDSFDQTSWDKIVRDLTDRACRQLVLIAACDHHPVTVAALQALENGFRVFVLCHDFDATDARHTLTMMRLSQAGAVPLSAPQFQDELSFAKAQKSKSSK